MKMLVLGGTGFIGKRLVRRLAAHSGVEVVVCSRREPQYPLPANVEHRRCDRDCVHDMERLANQEWDVVYDHICLGPRDAEAVSDLRAAARHYVMVSSQAVYGAGFAIAETAFDASGYPARSGSHLGYGEAKRRAEAKLHRSAPSPFTAVRLSPVLGVDDPRNWLGGVIAEIATTGRVFVENPDAVISLTHADEAASFLRWVGVESIRGPINLASWGPQRIGEIIGLIAQQLRRDVVINRVDVPRGGPLDVHTGWERDARLFPLSVHSDWVQSPERAHALGFGLSDTAEWLPAMITHLCLRWLGHSRPPRPL